VPPVWVASDHPDTLLSALWNRSELQKVRLRVRAVPPPLQAVRPVLLAVQALLRAVQLLMRAMRHPMRAMRHPERAMPVLGHAV